MALRGLTNRACLPKSSTVCTFVWMFFPAVFGCAYWM